MHQVFNENLADNTKNYFENHSLSLSILSEYWLVQVVCTEKHGILLSVPLGVEIMHG